MAKPKENPRLALRVVGIGIILGVLFLGFGMPLMLGDGVVATEETSTRIGQVVGGGIGVGGFLIALSFILKKPE